GAVDRDARGTRELARARAGDARLAGARAHFALRRAVRNSPPPGGDEVALGVELLHARVAAVGDVHGATRLIDRHPHGGLELAGARPRAAKMAERQEKRVGRGGAQRERQGTDERERAPRHACGAAADPVPATYPATHKSPGARPACASV